ncbi:capsular biosynthesis protein, partial [Klebsiella sp. CVUAS 10191.3]|nr:capsular biosynthesis protein [Klebsiella sp. CVUAS 10191.3]
MSDIDFVVLWVDSDDRRWQNDFLHYKTIYSDTYKLAITPSRFRDMGLFKYWFRAVENYAPWVRKVHLVTCGQVPTWLDKSYHKINLVPHSDIIDEKYLPTFNSRAIEVNIHKIKDLSEQFVYFNDDMLLNAPINS